MVNFIAIQLLLIKSLFQLFDEHDAGPVSESAVIGCGVTSDGYAFFTVDGVVKGR